MNIWLGIYLLGCLLALVITIIELIRPYDTKKQYGLIPVVIMLSWVSVCAWLYGYFYDKNS